MKKRMKKEIEKCMDIARRFAERLVDPEKSDKSLDPLFEEKPALRELYESIARDMHGKRRGRTSEERWHIFQKKFLNRKPRRGVVFLRYTAVVGVLASVTAFWSLYTHRSELPEQKVRVVSQSLPTLSVDNKVYTLDLEGLSELERVSRVARQTESDKIVYLSDSVISVEQEWHTVQVPRQMKFPVTLADGTRVSLNAGTTLRYPVPFLDTIREIWLEGEAYFEVSPDKNKPFVVHFGENRVKVLGTSFNVSCYADRPNYTTLVNGSICLLTPDDSVILKPGEVGIVVESHGIDVQKADVEETMAWLNRKFYFCGKTLSEIMLSIGEWYGVEIRFEDEVSRNMVFSVETERYETIDSVLRIIESTEKVHFIRGDNHLTVKCNSL